MKYDPILWGKKKKVGYCKASIESVFSFLEEKILSQTIHGKRILVVTHKTTGRIIVQAIENKEHQHFRSIPMENASLRKIVVKGNTMKIPYYIKVLDGEIVSN